MIAEKGGNFQNKEFAANFSITNTLQTKYESFEIVRFSVKVVLQVHCLSWRFTSGRSAAGGLDVENHKDQALDTVMLVDEIAGNRSDIQHAAVSKLNQVDIASCARSIDSVCIKQLVDSTGFWQVRR